MDAHQSDLRMSKAISVDTSLADYYSLQLNIHLSTGSLKFECLAIVFSILADWRNLILSYHFHKTKRFAFGKNHQDIIIKTHELHNYLVIFSHSYRYHRINYFSSNFAIKQVYSIIYSQFKVHLKYLQVLPLCLMVKYFETIKYQRKACLISQEDYLLLFLVIQ